MTRWTGIVLALSNSAAEEMVSRLVTYLHPIAGRPLVWHSASSLAALVTPPEQIIVIAGVDLSPALFQDIPADVQVLLLRDVDLSSPDKFLSLEPAERLLVMDAAALPRQAELEALLAAPEGSWIPDGGAAAAASISPSDLALLTRRSDPLGLSSDALRPELRIEAVADSSTLVVHNRAELAIASQRIRDRLVRSLMDAGATFLLPDSVVVDVDVRIGRDSIIYPGVVLEGQTTIGEETVVGPGCRIMDSWVGSGVELRGWNYISHTSIRNRAILEPYVRRGFD